MNKQNSKIFVIFLCIAITVLALFFCSDNSKKPISEQSKSTISTSVDNLSTTEQTQPKTNASNNLPFKLSDIPRYSGSPFCEVNNNKPYYHSDELTTDSFRRFSELDSLGRCGVAFACIGTDSLPTEERGAIGMIKPSGWHTVRYDDLIEDKYLYNRCHLIAFELSGENANPQNLINLNRLEAALYNIDGRIERTQDNLAKLRLDHAEAQKIVAEPFPQQEELDTKEQRLKVVTDELNQAAIEAKKNAPKREKTCYFERAKMKRDAARLAKKPRAPKDQTKGRSKKQGIE